MPPVRSVARMLSRSLLKSTCSAFCCCRLFHCVSDVGAGGRFAAALLLVCRSALRSSIAAPLPPWSVMLCARALVSLDAKLEWRSFSLHQAVHATQSGDPPDGCVRAINALAALREHQSQRGSSRFGHTGRSWQSRVKGSCLSRKHHACQGNIMHVKAPTAADMPSGRRIEQSLRGLAQHICVGVVVRCFGANKQFLRI